MPAAKKRRKKEEEEACGKIVKKDKSTQIRELKGKMAALIRQANN